MRIISILCHRFGNQWIEHNSVNPSFPSFQLDETIIFTFNTPTTRRMRISSQNIDLLQQKIFGSEHCLQAYRNIGNNLITNFPLRIKKLPAPSHKCFHSLNFQVLKVAQSLSLHFAVKSLQSKLVFYGIWKGGWNPGIVNYFWK